MISVTKLDYNMRKKTRLDMNMYMLMGAKRSLYGR